VKKILIAALIVLPLVAQAKKETLYNVSVDTSNTNDLGNLATYVTGFDCTSSTSLNYSEQMLNSNGRYVQVQKDGTWDYSWSTLFSGSRTHVDMPFTRNGYTKNPLLEVTLRETCERTYDCEDEDGNDTTCTETHYLTWACGFNQFPEQKGQSLQSTCLPRDNNWFADPILRIVRQKVITATVTKKSVQETVSHDACHRDGKSMLLHVEQGLGGHFGENDFSLIVTLNGQDYQILSKSGSYADDIRVCAQSGTISFKVRGVEDDMFFDDLYKSTDGTYSMPLIESSTLDVVLTRKKWFGLFGALRKSTVVFSILPDDAN